MSEETEVLYEPPRGSPRALVASWVAAGLFLTFVLWTLWRLLRSPVSMAIALAVAAAVVVAQGRYADRDVRATLRVVADKRARTLTWTWRGGELTLPWDEIETIAAEGVTGGDGVDLAAVAVRRAGGEALRFGVHGDAAAKGIVAAVGALREA